MNARNITIQNLSSGDILHFRSTSITKYSSRYNINYDSTQVIGRMDPIRNFKNTERIVNASFFVKKDKILLYKVEEPIDTQAMTDNFLKFHKGETINPTKATNPSVLFNDFNRFFYPSYEKEAGGAGQYFMKSAPVFRVNVCNFADNGT